MFKQYLSQQQRDALAYWLPALIAGILAGLAFTILGRTPPVRSAGLALSVVGVALTLRRFNGTLAVIGGLALAFSPAFWSQTGGRENDTLGIIAILLGVAVLVALFSGVVGKHPVAGLGLALVIFAVLFWMLVGTPRSLRLTTFLTAWMLYLLIDGLLLSNPRPDGPAPVLLARRHTLGLLLLLSLGVLNDPLVILMIPAITLGLILSQTPLPRWYWAGLAVVALVGMVGVGQQYLNSNWWLFPAGDAEALNVRVPFVMADGWREGSRWLYLFNLVIGQFSIVGVLLGVIGLARLARWYPPLGVVTMIAYASYAVFGLVYFGRNAAVLLLPLLMIQVIWMTYAVHTFGDWLQKSIKSARRARWVLPAAFVLLPLTMLLRIAGIL